MERSLHEKDWDDLDIYDREAAEIRTAIKTINIKQWVKDLYTLDHNLFDKLYKEMNEIRPTHYY